MISKSYYFFYLYLTTVVGQVEQGLDKVEATPRRDLFVGEVGAGLKYVRGRVVELLFRKAEHVRVPQDLLEEGELALCILPVAVEQVHGEPALQALCLQTQLECLHQQDETGPVLHDEARMIQLEDDFLPVDGVVQLVDGLDKHLHVPRLFTLFRFIPSGAVVRRR